MTAKNGYKFKRQIEFRARAIGDGQMVYGYYRHFYIPNGLGNWVAYDSHKIYDPVTGIEHDVEPLSVQVFTGFDDNGKKIFKDVFE